MINDDFVDTTIANLKVIGMVPKNGKLCVRKGHLCLDYLQAQAFRRWMNGDSRDTTIMHAKTTLTNAMRIARSIISCAPSNPDDNNANWTLYRLIEEIRACEIGLENLKTTYVNDSMMLANLEVIIERRRANMAEIQAFLDGRRGYNCYNNAIASAPEESTMMNAEADAILSEDRCEDSKQQQSSPSIKKHVEKPRQ